jgi:hypothetical protein
MELRYDPFEAIKKSEILSTAKMPQHSNTFVLPEVFRILPCPIVKKLDYAAVKN